MTPSFPRLAKVYISRGYSSSVGSHLHLRDHNLWSAGADWSQMEGVWAKGSADQGFWTEQSHTLRRRLSSSSPLLNEHLPCHPPHQLLAPAGF